MVRTLMVRPKVKDETTEQSLGQHWREDPDEQAEQGLEGEGCLMMSRSLLGKQALSSETPSCSSMAHHALQLTGAGALNGLAAHTVGSLGNARRWLR